MVVMGVWAFILCTGHRWRKTKEQQPWNNTKQIFPEQKTKKSFALGHLCPVHELWVEIWNPLISGQIVNSFGQGKCTFDCQSGNFKNSSSGCPCLNKVMHVENWETDQLQHDSYVSISYKFTIAWVFVSYAYTQITVNTFTNDLILFTGIIQCWWGYCVFNDRHKHNSRQLHP